LLGVLDGFQLGLLLGVDEGCLLLLGFLLGLRDGFQLGFLLGLPDLHSMHLFK